MGNKAVGITWDEYKRDYMSEAERSALRERVEAIQKEIDAEELNQKYSR